MGIRDPRSDCAACSRIKPDDSESPHTLILFKVFECFLDPHLKILWFFNCQTAKIYVRWQLGNGAKFKMSCCLQQGVVECLLWILNDFQSWSLDIHSTWVPKNAQSICNTRNIVNGFGRCIFLSIRPIVFLSLVK